MEQLPTRVIPESQVVVLPPGPPSRPEPAEGAIELMYLLYRHRMLVLVTTLIGIVVGLLATVVQTPVYQAKATIEIKDLNENFLDMKQFTPVTSGGNYTDLTDIQTQVELLQSETLISRVFRKLKATEQLAGASRADAPASALLSVRKALHLSTATPGEKGDVAGAARNLKVHVAGQTRIVELMFDSTSPGFAAAFINTLAQEFIESNLEARWALSQQTSQWLSRQLEDMRVKLERSEDAVQSYARQAGLTFTSDRSTTEGSNVSDEKLRQLQSELSKATADRIERQARWELATKNTRATLPDAINDRALQELQDRITDLRRQREELTTTYTEKNSRVQRIDAQITLLNSALQEQRQAAVQRITSEYQSTVRREKLLSDDYARQLQRVTDEADKSIKYNILKREADSNRQLYDSMLQRVKESTIASAMHASNVRIVDLAGVPSLPYKPNVARTAALGLIAGLLVGAGFVLLRAKAMPTFDAPGDAQAWLNLPQLGVIPTALGARRPGPMGRLASRNAGQRSPILLAKRSSGLHDAGDSLDVRGGDSLRLDAAFPSEAFRALVTSILFAAPGANRSSVLVVTSADAGEGKTTVASHVGRAFAGIGRKVLLIDGDTARGRLHDVFGVSNAHGLTTLLRGDAPAPELRAKAILDTEFDGLCVLPAGPAVDDANYAIYSDTLHDLVARLREQFEVIIIDTPPMLLIPDARVFAHLADGVALVTRAGRTRREAALAACQRLTEDRARVLGVILNDWNPKSSPGSHYRRYSSLARAYPQVAER